MFEILFVLLIWALIAVALFLVGFGVALVYGQWYWDKSEKTGKRRYLPLREWRVWNLLHHYFNIRIESRSEPAEGKRVLYVFYPHSLFAFTPILMHLRGQNKDAKRFFGGNSWLGGASAFFYFPLVREFATAMGALSADRASLNTFMKKQPHDLKLTLAPGGLRGGLRATYGEDDIYLGHAGFIQFFEDHQFDMMVPVYAENESNVFWSRPWLLRARDFCLTHLRWPLLLFFFPFPLPTNLTAHMGKPCVTAEEFIDELLFLLPKEKKVRFWTDVNTVWEGMESASSVRSAFLDTVSKRRSRADRPKQQ